MACAKFDAGNCNDSIVQKFDSNKLLVLEILMNWFSFTCK